MGGGGGGAVAGTVGDGTVVVVGGVALEPPHATTHVENVTSTVRAAQRCQVGVFMPPPFAASPEARRTSSIPQ
jgi:hypothetical protein